MSAATTLLELRVMLRSAQAGDQFMVSLSYYDWTKPASRHKALSAIQHCAGSTGAIIQCRSKISGVHVTVRG